MPICQLLGRYNGSTGKPKLIVKANGEAMHCAYDADVYPLSYDASHLWTCVTLAAFMHPLSPSLQRYASPSPPWLEVQPAKLGDSPALLCAEHNAFP